MSNELILSTASTISSSNQSSSPSSKAYQLYNRGFTIEAYDILSQLLMPDGSLEDSEAFITYIACCLELDKKIELFQMISVTSKKLGLHELSYYGYGAHHYSVKRYDTAQMLLMKCLEMNPKFGYAALLLGHIYSTLVNPHESLNMYLEAIDGLGFTHELHFVSECQSLLMNGFSVNIQGFDFIEDYEAASSPYVWHELGVLYFQSQDYEKACKYFLQTFQLLSKLEIEPSLENLPKFLDVFIDPYWYPLYCNLGHTLFFMKKYFNAIYTFRATLHRAFKYVEACKMIGYCYVALGKPQRALGFLHNVAVYFPNDQKLRRNLSILGKVDGKMYKMPDEDLEEALLCCEFNRLKA